MALTKNPKLSLIPSGYKASKVYSVLPSDGVGDFDFSRSGNATRVNKQGLIETVSSNVPRLNYPLIDGVVSGCPSLLLEPQRLQLTQYSEDFGHSSWLKVSLTNETNQAISPDGTLNSNKCTQSGGTQEHAILNTISVVSGTKYTASVFIKYIDWQYLQVRFRAGGFSAENGIIYDAINKTKTAENGSLISYKIEEYPNDWVRVSITAQTTASDSVAGLVVSFNNSPTVFDDVDNVPNTGKSFYLWGAQIEAGSFLTSYIPNYGTALGVTRLAETCNNAGDVNTFNDSEGVLMAEISALDNDGTFRRVGISDSSISDRVIIGFTNVSNQIQGFASSNGGVVSNMNYTVSDTKTNNKVCLRYKQDYHSLWINGFEVLITPNANTPIGLSELAFDSGGGLENFYGNTKQIQYFDTALTDTDLEELTSWSSFNEMANAQLYTII